MNKRKSLSIGLIFTFFLCINLISCSTGNGPTPVATPLKIFISSTSGNANLGSWTDAGGNTGLAAGDAICQAAATAAGLSGTYRAWISDSTADAYCHVQGYTGTIATNCGQSALPVAAGPWVRTDGAPFADTIDKLVTGQIFTPLQYDETGTKVAYMYVFTGTNPDGTLETYTSPSPYSCNGWTSNSSDKIIVGDDTGTTRFWTAAAAGQCSQSMHLVCMQTGTGGALPARSIPSGAKRVFATSTAYQGNFGGISAADSYCQTQAVAGGLSGTFVAWLSDSTTDAYCHIQGYTGTIATNCGQSTLPASTSAFYRPDGVKVADSMAALTVGYLFTAITETEAGTYVGVNYAWTGTGTDGAGTGTNCSNWTDNTSGVNGSAGLPNESDVTWTNWSSGSDCARYNQFYCVER